jgi:hypothetical protein
METRPKTQLRWTFVRKRTMKDLNAAANTVQRHSEVHSVHKVDLRLTSHNISAHRKRIHREEAHVTAPVKDVALVAIRAKEAARGCLS